jgi:hypothetical protein
VAVPEATVHKYDSFPFGQYDVWLTREIATMQTEAVPHSVQDAANFDLRLRVKGADLAHNG